MVYGLSYPSSNHVILPLIFEVEHQKFFWNKSKHEKQTYELRIYIFEPHGGNEEKVTLLTFNGTNYWGETGLTVQMPTLIISNHYYH